MNAETKLAELERNLRSHLSDVVRMRRELTQAPREHGQPLLEAGPLGVVAQVSTRLGSTIADTIGGRKFKGAVAARLAAALVLRRLGFSFPEIAELLGYADHTSALHACGLAKGREASSPSFRDAVAFGVSRGEAAGLQLEPYSDRAAAVVAAARLKYPQHGCAPVNEFCKCPKCQASVAV